MRKLLFVCIALINNYLFAQNQQPDDSFSPQVIRAVFQPESKIKITTYDEGFEHTVTPGKLWVFNYYYKAKDNINIIDDEFSEYFRFEIIPTSKKKFTLSNNELLRANFIYNRGCFCPETGNYKISKGKLTATRVNKNKYKIDVIFFVEPRDKSGMMQPVERKVSAEFIRGKINMD